MLVDVKEKNFTETTASLVLLIDLSPVVWYNGKNK